MHPSYLLVYAVLLIVAGITYSSAYLVYVYGSMRASRIIHKVLLESVLGTTLRSIPHKWFHGDAYIFPTDG